MTLANRVLFYVLRWLDDLWPGWGAPTAPPEDYLSHASFSFWMTREGRRGSH